MRGEIGAGEKACLLLSGRGGSRRGATTTTPDTGARREEAAMEDFGLKRKSKKAGSCGMVEHNKNSFVFYLLRSPPLHSSAVGRGQ